MATSRYEDRVIAENRNDLYRDLMTERGVNKFVQYSTPKLRHPAAREIANLQIVGKSWQLGDRFYKLAAEHYGDFRYWWVIAWYNQKPTEAHVAVGDVVEVPLPLDKVLRYLGM